MKALAVARVVKARAGVGVAAGRVGAGPVEVDDGRGKLRQVMMAAVVKKINIRLKARKTGSFFLLTSVATGGGVLDSF